MCCCSHGQSEVAGQLDRNTSACQLPACRSTYLVAGFFGAAMYGDQTNSNALVNEWLPGVGTVILNLVSWQLLIEWRPRSFHGCCSGFLVPACLLATELATADAVQLLRLAAVSCHTPLTALPTFLPSCSWLPPTSFCPSPRSCLPMCTPVSGSPHCRLCGSCIASNIAYRAPLPAS